VRADDVHNRRVLYSQGLRRRTYDLPPDINDFDGGYALPAYVLAERHGRGVYKTKQAPRRTITQRIPDPFGSDEVTVPVPGSQGDPIAVFGREVAEYIVRTLPEVPDEQRMPALRALFDQLDPKLYLRVESKMLKLMREGYEWQEALRVAVASGASQGLLEQFVRVGQTKKLPPVNSLAGLGAYGPAAEQWILLGFEQSMACACGLAGAPDGLGRFGSRIKKAAKKVGSAFKSGISKAADWAKKTVRFVGKAACKVSSNPAGQMAAAGGAAAMGAPPQAGVIGTQVVASACAKDVVPPLPPPPPPPPQWVVPAAIGGGALLLVLALR